MVWHIFKKDWKLLWFFALMAGSLQWISVFVFYKLGLFNEDATLEMLGESLPKLAFFASMFLIAAIVHLEALPGIREDWLHVLSRAAFCFLRNSSLLSSPWKGLFLQRIWLKDWPTGFR